MEYSNIMLHNSKHSRLTLETQESIKLKRRVGMVLPLDLFVIEKQFNHGSDSLIRKKKNSFVYDSLISH